MAKIAYWTVTDAEAQRETNGIRYCLVVTVNDESLGCQKLASATANTLKYSTWEVRSQRMKLKRIEAGTRTSGGHGF